MGDDIPAVPMGEQDLHRLCGNVLLLDNLIGPRFFQVLPDLDGMFALELDK